MCYLLRGVFSLTRLKGCWVFTVPETSNITMFDVRDSGPLVAAILKNPEATNGKFVAAASFHGSLDEIVDTLQQHTGRTSLNL